MGLDLVGLIPAAGNLCDLANVAISLYRERYFEAGLCVAAVVPIYGQSATAAKLGRRGIKYVDEVLQSGDNALRWVDEVAPNSGFALFGRTVPPPSGPASSSLRDLFICNAESPLFRGRVDLWNKLRGRSPVDWDAFMTRLRSADFNDYTSWAEARKSLGFASSGPNGWLFGLAKPLRQIPGIRNAATRHELFHAMDDLTTGLFGRSKTVGLWLRAETGAHLIGGPLIGVPAFGFLGWSIYAGIDGITDLWEDQ